MSYTRSTTDVHVHRNMPDYPTGEGISASDLKTAFDSEAEGLQDDINRLATELEDTTSAANIGAAALTEGDTSDANVQAKLEKLQAEIQDAVLGDIPDGTITEAKLNDDYAASIAIKDGNLQTGLNSEKLNSKTEAQLKSAFLSTPDASTISFTGVAKNTQTVTESKTLSTNGGRFYLMIFSYDNCKLGLYDADTQKFLFATYLGGSPSPSNETNTFGFNTSRIGLENGRYKGNAELQVYYSSGTMTLNVTKTPKENYAVASGSITIIELGGIV